MRRDGKDYEAGPGKFSTVATTSPARIDLIREPNDPKRRLVSQGIYQVEGDTLLIRTPERGEGRPESFDAPGKGYRVILKRAKKD